MQPKVIFNSMVNVKMTWLGESTACICIYCCWIWERNLQWSEEF